MKNAGILMLALALSAACDSDNDNPAGPSSTGPIVFTSQLSAANEVPPVTNSESTARGNVTITFTVPRDPSGNITGGGTASFAMQVNGFAAATPIIAGHIHPGAAGQNGSPIVNTNLSAAAPFLLADGTGNLTIGNIPVSQDLATQITNNPAGYYFNLHTPLNPGGAVRGQLTRAQ